MTDFRPVRPLLALGAAGLLLAGCADRTPTFGERVAAQGGKVAAIGQDWTAGQSRIDRGKSLISSGQDRIDRGQKLIRQGQDDVENGRRMVATGQSAEDSAVAAYRGTGANADEAVASSD